MRLLLGEALHGGGPRGRHLRNRHLHAPRSSCVARRRRVAARSAGVRMRPSPTSACAGVLRAAARGFVRFEKFVRLPQK